MARDERKAYAYRLISPLLEYLRWLEADDEWSSWLSKEFRAQMTKGQLRLTLKEHQDSLPQETGVAVKTIMGKISKMAKAELIQQMQNHRLPHKVQKTDGTEKDMTREVMIRAIKIKVQSNLDNIRSLAMVTYAMNHLELQIKSPALRGCVCTFIREYFE